MFVSPPNKLSVHFFSLFVYISLSIVRLSFLSLFLKRNKKIMPFHVCLTSSVFFILAFYFSEHKQEKTTNPSPRLLSLQKWRANSTTPKEEGGPPLYLTLPCYNLNLICLIPLHSIKFHVSSGAAAPRKRENSTTQRTDGNAAAPRKRENSTTQRRMVMLHHPKHHRQKG